MIRVAIFIGTFFFQGRHIRTLDWARAKQPAYSVVHESRR